MRVRFAMFLRRMAEALDSTDLSPEEYDDFREGWDRVKDCEAFDKAYEQVTWKHRNPFAPNTKGAQ